MISTTNEYKKTIARSRNFLVKCPITLLDSTVIDTDVKNLRGASFDERTSESGNFTIGSACIEEFSIEINNIDEEYMDYDFTGAKIRPQLGLLLSESTEWIPKGVYKVSEHKYFNGRLSLVCLDNMANFEKEFSDVSISFPCTHLQLLQAVCTHCEVTLTTVDFNHNNMVISTNPFADGDTCIKAVSYIAQAGGTFARINNSGLLELRWYPEFPNILDGNGNADIIDGNGTVDIIDGNAEINYHHIYSLGSMTVDVDDVVITGIKVIASDETVTSLGQEGYVLEIKDNPLIDTQSKANAIANSVGSKIIGMKFRPLSITGLGDPAIEAGDIAFVTDRKGRTYQTLLTHIGFKVGGYETFECDAKSSSRNNAPGFNPVTEAVTQAKRDTKKQLTSYDLAVITLTEAIVNGLGLYQTVSGDEIEGRIIYQHDKPTMEQSVKRWFRTSEGYIQQTRPNTSSAWVTTSGTDIYGNALYNTIIARGVDAEWIRVLTSFTVGSNFSVDSLGNLIAKNANITGTITSPNANITGGSVNINTESRDYSAIELSYSIYKSKMSPYALSVSTGDGIIGSVLSAGALGITAAPGTWIAVTPSAIGMYRNSAIGSLISTDELSRIHKLEVTTSLYVSGTKNRIVKTKNYGEVLLNAYETPRPTFADTGHGTIGEDGICYIDIDSVFYESIDTIHDYRYFLTKYGQGDLWIDKELSTKEYFVVRGTVGLEFDWKIEAIQRDYNTHNLEKYENARDEEKETDYISLASQYLAEHEKELIA